MRHIVKSVKPRSGQLGAGHVNAVLELARHGQNGTSLPLPGGVEVRKERDALAFYAVGDKFASSAPSKAREFEYNIDLAHGADEVRVPELGCVFRFRVIDWPAKRAETSRDGAVLDRDRLRFPLMLRNWRSGDRMRPLGHRSAHKLKRLLNEKHVSRWAREGWPVLTSGGSRPCAKRSGVFRRTYRLSRRCAGQRDIAGMPGPQAGRGSYSGSRICFCGGPCEAD